MIRKIKQWFFMIVFTIPYIVFLILAFVCEFLAEFLNSICCFLQGEGWFNPLESMRLLIRPEKPIRFPAPGNPY